MINILGRLLDHDQQFCRTLPDLLKFHSRGIPQPTQLPPPDIARRRPPIAKLNKRETTTQTQAYCVGSLNGIGNPRMFVYDFLRWPWTTFNAGQDHTANRSPSRSRAVLLHRDPIGQLRLLPREKFLTIGRGSLQIRSFQLPQF
jgi:hypothetical protein